MILKKIFFLFFILILSGCYDDNCGDNGCNHTDTLSVTAIPEQTITIGKPAQYQSTVKYTGTGTVTYSLSGAPSFITINASTGLISVDATEDSDKGVYSVTVNATDGKVAAQTTTSFHVLEPDTLSVTAIPEQTITIGKSAQYQSTVKYTGTGTVTYSLSGAPSFITINASTGLISVDATEDSDKGVYSVTVNATDGKVAAQTTTSFHVLEPDTLSVTAITEQTLTRNEVYQYQTEVKYTGTGTVKYSLIDAPSFLSINESTGLILADTANLLTSQTYSLKVSATDGIVSANTPVEYNVVLSPTLEKCLAGTITPVTTGSLYALSGSLFSDVLYVQGNGDWKPTNIQFKIEDKEKNPIEGCYIYVRPQLSDEYPTIQPSTTIYFPENSVSDENGLVSGYWESRLGTSGILLASLLSNTTDTTEIHGVISTESFRNDAPAVYLGFGSDYTWKEFNIDITILEGSNPTFWQIANWFGGYVGLQQADWKEEKKLIFSIWKTKLGNATLLTNDSYCVPMTDSEGTFIHCLMDYVWEYGNTYTFKVTAEHNVANAIDYTVYVNEKGSSNITTVATIRQPQPEDYYPGSPSSFIEQWTNNQFSCMAIQQRTAIYSNITAIKPNETEPFPITEVHFSRPYIASYGQGSLCFNYLYGNLATIPLESLTDTPLAITEGFVAGVGGKIIAYPSDGGAQAALPDIPLTNTYYQISNTELLNKITVESNYLSQLLFEHNKIQLILSEEISPIKLPNEANHLNLINVVNNTTSTITIIDNNSNPILIEPKGDKSFSYYDATWNPF